MRTKNAGAKVKSTTRLVPPPMAPAAAAPIFDNRRGPATVDNEEEPVELVAVGGGARENLAMVPDDFQGGDDGHNELPNVLIIDANTNRPLTGWRRSMMIAYLKAKGIIVTGWNAYYGAMSGTLATGSLPIFIRFIVYGPTYEYSPVELACILSATSFTTITSGYTVIYMGARRGLFSALDNDVKTLVGMQLQIWPYINFLDEQRCVLMTRQARIQARQELIQYLVREQTHVDVLDVVQRADRHLSEAESRANRFQQTALCPRLEEMRQTIDSIEEYRNQANDRYYRKWRSKFFLWVLIFIGALTLAYAVGFGFPTYLPLNWNAIVASLTLKYFIPFIILGILAAPIKFYEFIRDGLANYRNDGLLLTKLPDVILTTRALITKAEASLAENNRITRDLNPRDPIVAPSTWNPVLQPDEYNDHERWLRQRDVFAQFQPPGIPAAAGIPGSSAFSGLQRERGRFFDQNDFAGQQNEGAAGRGRRRADEQPLFIQEERRGPAPGRGGNGQDEV